MTALIRANLPVLVVIAPLFVAFTLPPLARRIRLVEKLALLGTVLGLAGTGYLASIVRAQEGVPLLYRLGGWPAPWGIELVAGSLGVFFLLVVGVSVPVLLFAQGNLAAEVGGAERVTRLCALSVGQGDGRNGRYQRHVQCLCFGGGGHPNLLWLGECTAAPTGGGSRFHL